MIFADSHTHFYFEDYQEDLQACFDRALEAGVHYMVIPNVDASTIGPVAQVCETFPRHCFPAIGLHPTDVNANYREELRILFEEAQKRDFYAVGEAGLDLYWDKTFVKEQQEAFDQQIELALAKDWPLIIHSREAFDLTYRQLKAKQNGRLRGVFHCYSGSVEQARQVVDLGFQLGIGGVVTFKNSKLWQVVEAIDLSHLLLETDAPFITPHPHRGTRNESSYIPLIAQRIAEIKQIPLEDVARATTKNTVDLFRLPSVSIDNPIL